MDLGDRLKSPAALPGIPRVIGLLLAELGKGEPDLVRVQRLLPQDPVLLTRQEADAFGG